MMNLKEYFENILENEGYDAWEKANEELVAIYEDENADLETWANAHNIDLAVGEIGIGGLFYTYLQMWVWDNIED